MGRIYLKAYLVFFNFALYQAPTQGRHMEPGNLIYRNSVPYFPLNSESIASLVAQLKLVARNMKILNISFHRESNP